MEAAAQWAKETYDWPPDVEMPGARRLSLEEREERIYGQKQPSPIAQTYADDCERDARSPQWAGDIH